MAISQELLTVLWQSAAIGLAFGLFCDLIMLAPGGGADLDIKKEWRLLLVTPLKILAVFTVAGLAFYAW